MDFISEDIYSAYSPEREDPSNKYYKSRTISKVLGGFNQKSAEHAQLIRESVTRCKMFRKTKE